MVLSAGKFLESVSGCSWKFGVSAYIAAAMDINSERLADSYNWRCRPQNITSRIHPVGVIAWRVASQAFQMPDVDPQADPALLLLLKEPLKR